MYVTIFHRNRGKLQNKNLQTPAPVSPSTSSSVSFRLYLPLQKRTIKKKSEITYDRSIWQLSMYKETVSKMCVRLTDSDKRQPLA